MFKYWQDKFLNLKVNTNTGIKSPHKLLLIYTILDLIESGVITQQEIPIDDRIIYTFQKYATIMEKLRPSTEKIRFEFPFCYLASDLYHIILKNNKLLLGKIGLKLIRQEVQCIRFDDHFWQFLEYCKINRSRIYDLRISIAKQYFLKPEVTYFKNLFDYRYANEQTKDFIAESLIHGLDKINHEIIFAPANHFKCILCQKESSNIYKHLELEITPIRFNLSHFHMNNYLALCPIHHHFYNKGLWSIDEHFKIHYPLKFEQPKNSILNVDSIPELVRPSTHFLKWHHDHIYQQ